MRLIATIAVAVAVFAVTDTATAEPRRSPLPSLWAQAVVETWKCQDKIPTKRTPQGHYPWKPHSEAYRMKKLVQWRGRLKACQAFLKRRAFEWNWQAFPSWIIELARCETSVDWFAEGRSSHGTFYSAFNIGRTRYDDAAHLMGVRGWNEGPGVPSPWEQAMAVIGYVRIHGDGFTGSCAGIARSSW